MYRVKNVLMRNSVISTNYGIYTFNSEGVVNVPYGLAQELLQLSGFTLVDEDGNEIPFDETLPADATLPAGWGTVEGGYTLSDDTAIYTLSGSAFILEDGELVPSNVSIQDGELVFNRGIDTGNVHVIGVGEGDTVKIGDQVYIWKDIDNDLSNGYELDYINTSTETTVTPTVPAVHTLPGGGTWSTVEGGYVIGDDDMVVTLTGNFFDSDTIAVQSGTLVFSAGVDTSSIHIIGVDPDATVKVGDLTYRWEDTDGDPTNGLELVLVPTITPADTLPAGWSTVDGGYAIEDGTATYTVTGSFETSDVTIDNSTFTFSEGVDTGSIHVIGVESDATVYVGSDTYIWRDIDNNPENGLELVPYEEPEPEPDTYTLPGGETWTKNSDGIILSNGDVQYTIIGFDSLDSDTFSIQNGSLIPNNVDTNQVHVIGVESGVTVGIGTDTYVWKDLNDNLDDGLELEVVIAQTTSPAGTLRSGLPYDTVEGGYVISDVGTTYTLTADFQTPLEENVDVQGRIFSFSTNTKVSDVHAIGVQEGDTLYIGSETYVWKDTDNNLENGFEISKLVYPEDTLPAGWSTVDGGFVYTDAGVAYTISGITDVEDVEIDSGTITFSTAVDKAAIHVIGVDSDSTVYFGSDTYVWKDTDGDLTNGLEIAEYVPPVPEPEIHTLPGGGTYETIEGGYILSDTDTTAFTLMGGELDEDNISIQSGTLVFGTGIDTGSVHVIGVESDTTIAIGSDTYVWKDTDNNPENGLELELVTPTVEPEPTIPSAWSTINGGFVYDSDTIAYTLTGAAFGTGFIPAYTTIDAGKLVFSEGIDTANVHVIGVESDTTIQIGTDVYTWKDTDNNLENGLELTIVSESTETTVTPTVEPEPTLPAGWGTIEGGLTYGTGDTGITIVGATVDENGELPVVIDGETLIFSDGIDTDAIHAIGINSGDTVQVGDVVYKWEDTDNDPENGLELLLVGGESEVTILPTITPYNPWSTIPGGYIYNDTVDAITYTVTGIDNLDHTSVINGDLTFSEGIDTGNIHVLGVESDATITIGEVMYKWVNADNDLSNGLELVVIVDDTDTTITPTVEPEPTSPWSTIPGGYVYESDTVKYTLTGAAFTNGHDVVTVTANGLVFNESVEAAQIHVIGVESDTTIQIGSNSYTWKDTDNDLTNGLELEIISANTDTTITPTLEPEPGATLPPGWGTVEGGLTYTSDATVVTLTGVGPDAEYNIPVAYQDGGFIFSDGVDTDGIHAIGVTESDTVQVASTVYIWTDRDNNPENGLEITMITAPTVEPEPTVTSAWSTIEGGWVYESDTVKYTLTGSAFANGHENTMIDGGTLSFDTSIDTANVHVIGVESGTTIQIGTDTYTWTDLDNNMNNGLELKLVTSESSETTVTPTLPGGDTIPGSDTVVGNGFSYDFDGVAFTLSGGINENVSIDDLNEKAKIEKTGLEFGDGIISTLGGVHIQGLQSGTTVKVSGENYTLMDADGDLSNGYELVGGEADAYDWVRTNRSSGIYEPQIWRHQSHGVVDILVIGCTARPLYENGTLTLLGKDIKVISNESAPAFKVAGDVVGKLTTGVGYDIAVGIVNGAGTDSYIVIGGTLYVPNGIITGVSTDIQFTLSSSGALIVTGGTLDVNNMVVKGNAVLSIDYDNKKYYVNVNTGTLVRNAWQRR